MLRCFLKNANTSAFFLRCYGNLSIDTVLEDTVGLFWEYVTCNPSDSGAFITYCSPQQLESPFLNIYICESVSFGFNSCNCFAF